MAKLRGHKSHFMKKTDKLGGHLIEAQVPILKMMRRDSKWYENE